MKYLQFDGKARDYLFVGIAAYLITLITFGLGFPWATTMLLRWKASHTILNGQRMVFTGSGSSLFGKWIVWWVLTILTFGLFGMIVWARYSRWVVENTAIHEPVTV